MSILTVFVLFLERLDSISVPVMDSNSVRVQMVCAPINPADINQIQGMCMGVHIFAFNCQVVIGYDHGTVVCFFNISWVIRYHGQYQFCFAVQVFMLSSQACRQLGVMRAMGKWQKWDKMWQHSRLETTWSWLKLAWVRTHYTHSCCRVLRWKPGDALEGVRWLETYHRCCPKYFEILDTMFNTIPNITFLTLRMLVSASFYLPFKIIVGTWRTQHVLTEHQLIKIPSDLSMEFATTVGVNPCTAYRMLKDFKYLKPGASGLEILHPITYPLPYVTWEVIAKWASVGKLYVCRLGHATHSFYYTLTMSTLTIRRTHPWPTFLDCII